jgi:hypothetical protein
LYGIRSGTSLAAAHVSGVAALLFSHFPNCTNNQIRNAMIRSTAEPPTKDIRRNRFGWDHHYGWGIVNAGKAYELLTKGCVSAGGVYPSITNILSNQALGGIDQKVIGASPPFENMGSTLDTWTGISGSSIDDLMAGTNYLTNVPNQSICLINLLEGLNNSGNNSGSRIKGWLLPPVTGNYSFWIAASDNGEFLLSTDSDPANKVRACHTPGPVSHKNFTAYSEQKSNPISLVADQAYYYEVR